VRGEELICTKCLLEMPRANYHIERENPFYTKFRGRLPAKYVMTLFKFVKGGRVQHVLHALKYKNLPELGNALGRIYGHDLLQANYKNEFDLIIPVPLHISRKRKRGYNQSEEFGKGLAEILEIPCSDEFVKRLIKTKTQTRKSRLNRWENVSEVFSVVKPEAVGSKRILLVDDVVTTGATLEACGQVLIDAGCKELSIACIASAQ
jgi:ComF family protein